MVMWTGVKLAGLFAFHMALGAAFFIILAGISLGIDKVADYMSALDAAPALIYTCRAVEYFMLLADVLCVVVFVVAQTRNYVVRSWKDGR